MESTLFEKIISREIPADIIYEDDKCIVINDIAPQAPTHLLIIPKKVITMISKSDDDDVLVLGHLMIIAKKMASRIGLDDTFRLVVNNGAGAQQTVFHLHIHLLADREFTWPPG